MISYEEFVERFVNKEMCVFLDNKPFSRVYYYDHSRVWMHDGERRAIAPYNISDLYNNSREYPNNWSILSIEYMDFFGCVSKRCLL